MTGRPPTLLFDFGAKFGRLSVVKRVPGAKYECVCECGTTTIVTSANLNSGNTTSCGCFHRERQKVATRTHGSRFCRLYSTWIMMRQRCSNVNCPSFKNYGGRGIKISEEWDDFAVFQRDMGERPKGYSLERLDNDGPYSKDNCIWASRKQQSRNKRTSVVLSYGGRSMTLVEWAEYLGKPYFTLHARLRAGWSAENCLTVEIDRRRVKKIA